MANYQVMLHEQSRLPYNLYCVGGDVKHCTIQSNARTIRSNGIDIGRCLWKLLAIICVHGFLGHSVESSCLMGRLLLAWVNDKVNLEKRSEVKVTSGNENTEIFVKGGSIYIKNQQNDHRPREMEMRLTSQSSVQFSR